MMPGQDSTTRRIFAKNLTALISKDDSTILQKILHFKVTEILQLLQFDRRFPWIIKNT